MSQYGLLDFALEWKYNKRMEDLRTALYALLAKGVNPSLVYEVVQSMVIDYRIEKAETNDERVGTPTPLT